MGYPYRGYIRKKVNECAQIYLSKLYDFNRFGSEYINALLNSCGGIIKVGVGNDGFVSGIECTRSAEDSIKITLDNIIKVFHPKVAPSLYRLDFVPCVCVDYGGNEPVGHYKVIEVHISAGTEILYMEGYNKKSMVLHNGRPMQLGPQQIQALAVAKYKQEVLHAETLWDVITPACVKIQQSRLKKTTVMCTQTTPGLAPITTPKPASSSVSVGLGSDTPCPTPVAELFGSPATPSNTVVKNGNNKRSLSPDNSGTAVKRMPNRACKSTSKQTSTVEASPDIVCIGSYKPGRDSIIQIVDSSPGTPFARESNGSTVVKRVLRSSKRVPIKSVLGASLAKNPSDLFNETSTENTSDSQSEESEGRGRRKRRQHKAGDESSNGSKGNAWEKYKENSKCNTRARSSSVEKSDNSRSKSKNISKNKESSPSKSKTRSRSRHHSSEGRSKRRRSRSNSKERSESKSRSKRSTRSRKHSSSKSPDTRNQRQKERSRHCEKKAEKGLAASQSSAKKKGNKRAKPRTHPSCPDMVHAAVGALKKEKGSSLAAIKKYIAGNYKCDVEKLNVRIKNAAKWGVKKKTLKGKRASGSFRLGSKNRVDPEKAKLKKAKAAARKKAAPEKKKARREALKAKRVRKFKARKDTANAKKAANKAKRAANKSTKPTIAAAPKENAAKPKKAAHKRVKKSPQ